MVLRPSATSILQEPGRVLVIDRSLRPEQGDTLAFELFGTGYIGKLLGRAVITEDDEAFEGDVLEEIAVLGMVTWTMLDMGERGVPTI